jgi:hypothetical protein
MEKTTGSDNDLNTKNARLFESDRQMLTIGGRKRQPIESLSDRILRPRYMCFDRNSS